jgi:hypothetical protein
MRKVRHLDLGLESHCIATLVRAVQGTASQQTRRNPPSLYRMSRFGVSRLFLRGEFSKMTKDTAEQLEANTRAIVAARRGLAFCTPDTLLELLQSWHRARELEAALRDIVSHAEKHGMRDWPVFRRARYTLEKK